MTQRARSEAPFLQCKISPRRAMGAQDLARLHTGSAWRAFGACAHGTPRRVDAMRACCSAG